MHKRTIIIGIVVVVLVAAYYAHRQGYIFPISAPERAICVIGQSSVGGFSPSVSMEQNGLKVYIYAMNGSEKDNGFYFGYQDFANATSTQDFYDSFLRGQRDYDAAYPDETKGSAACTMAGVPGFCGMKDGKLTLFAWEKGTSYKVINNFSFDTKVLEPLVRQFDGCKAQ